jgi:hypothetical protein
MAILVHLTPQKDAERIVRRGLRATHLPGEPSRGLFCMPLLPDYFASHQWLRELRRKGARSFVAIDFRVSSTEPIYVGHYGHRHVATTVGRAVRMLAERTDARGWELILPRSVESKEIVKVRTVSRVVGWRYYPGANGRKPCSCEYCSKGEFGSRRMRERLNPPAPKETKPTLLVALEKAIALEDEAAIDDAIGKLLRFRDRATIRRVRALLNHPLPSVRRLAAEQLLE